MAGPFPEHLFRVRVQDSERLGRRLGRLGSHDQKLGSSVLVVESQVAWELGIGKEGIPYTAGVRVDESALIITIKTREPLFGKVHTLVDEILQQFYA